VSEDEALHYLKLRKIDDKQAIQIYQLVGGRMVHLTRLADQIEDGNTLEGMCTAENRVSFSLPLQLCTRRCSPTSKINSGRLEFFLEVVTTRTER